MYTLCFCTLSSSLALTQPCSNPGGELLILLPGRVCSSTLVADLPAREAWMCRAEYCSQSAAHRNTNLQIGDTNCSVQLWGFVNADPKSRSKTKVLLGKQITSVCRHYSWKERKHTTACPTLSPKQPNNKPYDKFSDCHFDHLTSC